MRAFDEQVANALEAIGIEAETFAKKNCPVDTGRLRNSITHASKTHSGYTHSYEDDEHNPYSYGVGSVGRKGEVYIGTNVEYAEAIETRDTSHKVGKAHFLRDAATQHGDRYEAIMKAALKS